MTHQRKLAPIILAVLLLLLTRDTTYAQISECEVSSVSPAVVSGGTSTQVVFSVQNRDASGNLLHFLKVIRPSSEFAIISADGPSFGGANISSDGSEVTINTTLSPSEIGEFVIGVSAQNTSFSPAPFVIKAANSENDEMSTCGGDSSVGISVDTQVSLGISNIRVASRDTSATVTWETGGSALGSVNYGATSSLGSTVSESSLGSTHSVTLSGLSPQSTYYYKIVSHDGQGTSLESATESFATAQVGAETTTTVTQETIVTNTVTNFVVKEIKDELPPSLKIITDLTKVFAESPEIVGTVSDDGGVSAVRYSTDGEKNWLLASLDNEVGAKKTQFRFQPAIVEDGNYQVIVEAVDSSGNKKKADAGALIIDRLLPKSGGIVFSIGPIVLEPETNGNFYLLSGANIDVAVSAIGGPTNVELSNGIENFRLKKNAETGLWIGRMKFSNPGTYALTVNLVDGALNRTNRIISNRFIVSSSGTLTLEDSLGGEAEISIYWYDNFSRKFMLWDASAFGQQNPQMVTNNKSYGVYLIPGKYYIEASASGYVTQRSKIFEVSSPASVAHNIVLKNVKFDLWSKVQVALGIRKVEEFDIKLGNVDSISSGRETNKEKSIVGQDMPYFEFSSKFRGKPTVFSFVNSWLPRLAVQIEELEKAKKDFPEVNFVLVGIQETKVRFGNFIKRGKYSLDWHADSDGMFVEPFGLGVLPLHVLVDKKGVITSVVYGTISEDLVRELLIY